MEINREALKSVIRIRRKKIFRAFSYFSLLCAAIFALSNFVFHFDRLYIKQIVVSGNKKVEDGQIFASVARALKGRYYGMYPMSNVLIYPKDMVIKTLRHDIPQVAAVSVVTNLDTLLIRVEEREPRYLWCDDFKKPMLDRLCYYLDLDGFSFDKAPNFSNHIYFEFYGGNKRGGYMGRSILPADELHSVVEIKQSIEEILRKKEYSFGNIYGVFVNNNGDYDLMLEDGKRESKIIFGLTTDVIKKLQAVLDSQFFVKELLNPSNHLEYIDLRFGKKVFYKFSKV